MRKVVEEMLLQVLQDSRVFPKAAATYRRYLAMCYFSWSLVHKKNFGLIWQVVFKLKYLITKLLLVFSFQKVFFIGQNLFKFFLFNFWSSFDISSRNLLFVVYFSLHQRDAACKYRLQRKPIYKFFLVSSIDVEKS